MQSEYDALVIGGGIIGVSTFYELVKSGQKTLLIEANEQVAHGASFANGGLLTPAMSDPWNHPAVSRDLFDALFSSRSGLQLNPLMIPSLAIWGTKFLYHSTRQKFEHTTLQNHALSEYSLRRTQKIANEHNRENLLERKGTLKLFERKSDFEAQLRIAKHIAGSSDLTFQSLSPADIAIIDPCLHERSKDLYAGISFFGDHIGDAREFCEFLLSKATTNALAFVKTKCRAHKLLVEGSRVVGVLTDKGPIGAANTIVCSGSQSNALLRTWSDKVSIKPVKGYSLTMDTQGWNQVPRVPVVDQARHVAVTPLGRKLRIVGGAEFTGHDGTISEKQTKKLNRVLRTLYPDLDGHISNSETQQWAGFRPMSYDGRPYIGPLAVEGLWVNTGHGHLGWTMAMGSAKLLSDLLSGEQTSLNPYPYSILQRNSK